EIKPRTKLKAFELGDARRIVVNGRGIVRSGSLGIAAGYPLRVLVRQAEADSQRITRKQGGEREAKPESPNGAVGSSSGGQRILDYRFIHKHGVHSTAFGCICLECGHNGLFWY